MHACVKNAYERQLGGALLATLVLCHGHIY